MFNLIKDITLGDIEYTITSDYTWFSDEFISALSSYYKEQYLDERDRMLPTIMNKFYFDLFINQKESRVKKYLLLFLKNQVKVYKSMIHRDLIRARNLYESHFSILSPQLKISKDLMREIRDLIENGDAEKDKIIEHKGILLYNNFRIGNDNHYLSSMLIEIENIIKEMRLEIVKGNRL